MNISGLDIKEMLSESEALILQSYIKKMARKGMVVADIGCWKGFSTAYIAEIVKENQGTLYCVDHWQGSVGIQHLADQVAIKDVCQLFLYNMESLDYRDIIKVLKGNSYVMAAYLDDSSLDAIFIDADHRYSAFIQDLIAWKPKVKYGGLMCGHDCNALYGNLDEEVRSWLLTQKDVDNSSFRNFNGHPGVTLGLYEILPKAKKDLDSSIWYWFNQP